MKKFVDQQVAEVAAKKAQSLQVQPHKFTILGSVCSFIQSFEDSQNDGIATHCKKQNENLGPT